MARKISPETALAVIKISIALTHTWPLPKGASSLRVLRFKIERFLYCANAFTIIVPAAYAVYDNDYDIVRVTKLWCVLGIIFQCFSQTILLSMHYERLQYLISEVEQTLKSAPAHERMIYQKYVDKCIVFYVTLVLVLFIAAVATAFVPILVGKTFPVEAKYPFDVDSEPVRSILYVQHVFVFWQTFSTVCLCCFMAYFIWFTTARFNILSQKFRSVSSTREIIICLQQHDELLRFAREVIKTFRSTMLSMLIVVSWATVGSGLTIASKASIADKAQFVSVISTAVMEVFSCSWPADYLMTASAEVGHAVYESLWYNQHVGFQQNIPFILMRSQIPLSVSLSSLLAPMSLNFFSSYLSTTFSYIMTLRIALNDDN